MNSTAGARRTGVLIPEGQLTPTTTRGIPGEVVNMARAETYAVEWVDDQGNAHKELMHCVSGQWFRAPNGENYAATLKGLAATGRLAKNLESAREKILSAQATPEIPSVGVDITGDEGP